MTSDKNNYKREEEIIEKETGHRERAWLFHDVDSCCMDLLDIM